MRKGDGGGGMAFLIIAAVVVGGAFVTGVASFEDGNLKCCDFDKLSSSGSGSDDNGNMGRAGRSPDNGVCTVSSGGTCPDSCGKCECTYPSGGGGRSGEQEACIVIDSGKDCNPSNALPQYSCSK